MPAYKIKSPKFRPKTGRPSESGLSRKELGPTRYYHLLNRLQNPDAPKRYLTGLCHKTLGHTEYMRQYRKLKRNEKNQLENHENTQL